MKKNVILITVILVSNLLYSQASGNVNYLREIEKQYPNDYIDVGLSSNSTTIKVKGLANVKADSYVAIFNVTQLGKTTKEVNELMDLRINQAIEKVKTKPNVNVFIDMVSFVPVYEYDVENKVFSKRTYNEVPKGFELKKNIHIEYKDPVFLNEIIAVLSNVEIYDLVKVDYFSTKLESVKKELRVKAKNILQDKLKNFESILTKSLDSLDKNIAEGYKVVVPLEMYNSYQSYSSSSLSLKKSARINNAGKSTTLYYQAVAGKNFDFVINPIVIEPVIQVMYELQLNIEDADEEKTNKEYFFVTPNGDLKKVYFN